MKKIFLFLLLVSSIAHGQIPGFTSLGQNVTFKRATASNLFSLPQDTFSIPTSLKQIRWEANKGDSIWVWSVYQQKWILGGGGGGGGSTLFPRSGTSTATGDVTGDLSGHTLTILNGSFALGDLAGNGTGVAQVDNSGIVSWSSGVSNLLVDSLGTTGLDIVSPRHDTLYHRLLNGGTFLTVDSLASGAARVNLDTSSSGLHSLIANYGGGVSLGAIGASPNANGASIASGVLTLQPASVSFGGVLTSGTQTIAGQKTMAAALFASNGLYSNTTAITSNLAVNVGGTGTSSTNGTIALKGSGTVGNRVIMTGGTAYTMTAANPYASLIEGNETVTEFSSGTHAMFARTAVLPLVVNNGSATTTDATTLYVGGPPTGTATITNPVTSLWVDNGISRFGGGTARDGEGSLTSASGSIANSETKILSSDLAMPANRLIAGSIIQITLHGTCTSTAAGAGTVNVRYGTGATTSDGLLQSFTLGAAQTSGTAVPFTLRIIITIRTTGGSATSDGGLDLINNGTTGISTTATEVIRGSATTINTATASTFLTVSYQSGNASTASTFQDASIIISYK